MGYIHLCYEGLQERSTRETFKSYSDLILHLFYYFSKILTIILGDASVNHLILKWRLVHFLTTLYYFFHHWNII